jgi:hypothetical protein
MVLALSTLLTLGACDGETGSDAAQMDVSDVPDGTQTAPVEHDAGDTACQGIEGQGPWAMSLEEWTSSDGTTFTHTRTFQVCADVPSLAQNDKGTLIAAYQGFEDKNVDSRWDKVAVRMSTDDGTSWGAQTFVSVEGLPEGTGRPFDPTLTFDPKDGGWRLYFSLTTNTKNQLDDDVCTHSAYSDDGVNYSYESSTRFCADNRPVIDPAVTLLDGAWYYSAPGGAPQDGAFFASSTDGLNFTEGSPIPSDKNHNWTGTLTSVDGALRFYGAEGLIPQGNFLWWAESGDKGVTWSDFQRTNIPGGKDPAVIRLEDGSFLAYVPTKNDP